MVKTHHALVMDRGVPTINLAVTSGAVYIVRNPLDVAISFAHHMSTDVDLAIEQMAFANLETGINERSVYEVYGSWSKHVESWTRKDPPHDLRHALRRTCWQSRSGFLAGWRGILLLRPTDDQLQLAIDRSSFEVLKKQEEESGFKEKPEKAERFFREGKAGQWQEKLSRRQVRRIVQGASLSNGSLRISH